MFYSKAILHQKGANRFIEVTLYSGHLINFLAKKTWPIGGGIIEVPLYTHLIDPFTQMN